ncbi:MAG: helix-turn-helix domain-containing protein [Bacteroides sp.]|nr:helix-turn-helix domain-containing protein [Bacillota bacterium]MCM1393386.1 helix-turn-helix domain-containing protein [[Eubacterium] siraeum]MCM1455534.1 helix-turn-helix domain-containing protein [Bacteroides sp.]
MEVKTKFANNLKFYRLQSKLTQQQVADKMNVTKGLYSKYERGIIQLDYDKIVQVCEIFDITPNDLFDGCFKG